MPSAYNAFVNTTEDPYANEEVVLVAQPSTNTDGYITTWSTTPLLKELQVRDSSTDKAIHVKKFGLDTAYTAKLFNDKARLTELGSSSGDRGCMLRAAENSNLQASLELQSNQSTLGVYNASTSAYDNFIRQTTYSTIIQSDSIDLKAGSNTVATFNTAHPYSYSGSPTAGHIRFVKPFVVDPFGNGWDKNNQLHTRDGSNTMNAAFEFRPISSSAFAMYYAQRGNLTMAYFNQYGLTASDIASNIRPTMFRFNVNGTFLGSIRPEITSGAYSGVDFFNNSDYRLKKNVTPLQQALAKINAVRPVSYHLKEQSDTAEKSAGFLAHELAEVLPQCVAGKKDDPDEYQQVNLKPLIPLLVQAVQELSQRVLNLEATIAVAAGSS